MKSWKMRYTLSTLSLGFLLGGYYQIAWKNKAYTDDAYVQGNQVLVTPLQSGFITQILTDDTFLVKEGQLLVCLDQTDATLALDTAKRTLALTIRKICSTFHEVFALEADVEAKKALFVKAAQDYDHRLGVIEEGGVSLEDFEHAQAELRYAFFSLHSAEKALEKTLSIIQNTSIYTHPAVLEAIDTVKQAWVNLYRCHIYAPVDGLIAQRNIQVGMWVRSGTPLLAIIPLEQIWVNANFKETQMKKMCIGQSVTLTSDLYGKDTVFHGTIVGLPGGAGNAFSLLPPQNLSGNWIKIVQRLPVRVSIPLEEIQEHPLRIGLSMEAVVDLSQKGPLVPLSSAGSPLYSTTIFQKEEQGVLEEIEALFQQNLDPLLEKFFHQPLH